MSKPVLSCLIFFLIPLTLVSADDPFVGKWKLNQNKSTNQPVQIDSLGGNRYKITLNGSVNTITADGSDQPADSGRTLSLKERNPNVWKVVWKKDGKPIDQSTWTIAADGQTMVQAYSVHLPNRESLRGQNKLKRIAGNIGLAGTWQFIEVTHEVPLVMEIQPYMDSGLTFLVPAFEYSSSMKFDGNEYPEHGPNIPSGSTSSGHRLDSHILETIDKLNGTVLRHQKWTISPDGTTLTVEEAGDGQTIYERVQ